MGEELQVIVQQEVGIINWNFDQLKTALAEKMQEYDGLVYTEDTVKVAKTDIASLRKLKKAISDKRIEIKNKCLEPYEIIEAQAAELTELIDKPINQIDVQLTEYEKNRKEAVRSKIIAYFDDFGKELPPDVLAKVKLLNYRDKWENISTSTKLWKQGVEDAVRAVERDLVWIEETVEEEFRESAVSAYIRNLELTEVMTEVTRMRKQKEIILAKERERIAAEERAKAEEEARKKIEAEKQDETEATAINIPKTSPDEREGTKKEAKDESAPIPSRAPQNSNMPPSRNAETRGMEIKTLRIKATEAQFAKIKGYIEYCGAIYREV